MSVGGQEDLEGDDDEVLSEKLAPARDASNFRIVVSVASYDTEIGLQATFEITVKVVSVNVSVGFIVTCPEVVWVGMKRLIIEH